MPKTKLTFEGDNRTGRAFREVNSSLGRMGSSVARVGSSLRGLTAILGAGLFARGAKGSLDFADKIGKLNSRLGASTEFLSEMRFAAEQTGVTFETFTMGLQRMQRRVAEAAQGTGEAKNALLELGINAKKLVGLSLEDQFDVIAQALSKVGSESDQVRLAMKLFDSEGVALLQTMEGGGEAVRALREEAQRLGVSLSKDATDGAAAANDAMNRISTSVRGVVEELAINFAPAISAVAQFLGEFIPRSVNLANAAFASLAGAVAYAFAQVVQVAGGALGKLAAAMEFFYVPGAGGVKDASEALLSFSDRVTGFGASALQAAGNSFDLAIGIKEVGKNAKTAKQSVDELAASVAGGAAAPDGSESVGGKGLDKLYANLFKTAAGQKGGEENEALGQVTDSIAGALVAGVESGGEGMKAAFKGILADLAAQALKSQLVNLLGGLFGGGGGGLASAIGGKQAGGQVVPGVYRVGENGPETLAIGQRAMVYANRGASGGGGGGAVYNIDARGAGPNAAAEIEAAIKRAELQTTASILDKQRRGRFR